MSSFDETVRGLLREELRAGLREELEPLREEIAALRAARQPAELEPLDRIMGCSAPAARMRIGRDKELRALGVPVGRRLYFRRGEVEQLLRQRANGASR